MDHRPIYVKHKTMELLKDNIRENTGDSGLGNEFPDTTAKAEPMKEI